MPDCEFLTSIRQVNADRGDGILKIVIVGLTMDQLDRQQACINSKLSRGDGFCIIVQAEQQGIRVTCQYQQSRVPGGDCPIPTKSGENKI